MQKLDVESVVRDHCTGPSPAGSDLVLLHCLGVDNRFFDPMIEGLSRRRTVWRYDLPGHGTARTAPGPYRIEDLSSQLASLMRTFGIARAHVAGISLGGLIAQQLAATEPQLVDKLVLIDTTPRYTDEMRGMWAKRAAGARNDGVASLVDDLLKIWFSKEAVAAQGAGVRYVRETLSRCDGEAYALACEALAAADLRPLVKKIAAPTLVICGNNDIPSFLDAAKWLTAEIEGAKLEWIPDTRHASILERPDKAVEIIETFLG